MAPDDRHQHSRIPPRGFEPRFQHPKCRVLPLDDGGATGNLAQCGSAGSWRIRALEARACSYSAETITWATATADRVSSTRGAGSLPVWPNRGSSTPRPPGNTPKTLDPEPLIRAGAQPRPRSRSTIAPIEGCLAATTASKSLVASASIADQSLSVSGDSAA